MSMVDKLRTPIEKSLDAISKSANKLWQIAKGDGFGKATHPKTVEESFSQGYLGPNTAITLSALQELEESINWFTGLDNHEFTRMIANMNRGFGKGKRPEGTFNTIANAKEVPDFSQPNYRAPSENVPINDRLNREQGN